MIACPLAGMTVTVSKNASDLDAKPSRAQSRRQHARSADAPAGRLRQALRAVIDRVHRGDDGQQHLRGADVGGRLLAADMLLARLQRQPIGGWPRESIDTPTSRPGIARLSASRTAI